VKLIFWMIIKVLRVFLETHPSEPHQRLSDRLDVASIILGFPVVGNGNTVASGRVDPFRTES